MKTNWNGEVWMLSLFRTYVDNDVFERIRHIFRLQGFSDGWTVHEENLCWLEILNQRLLPRAKGIRQRTIVNEIAEIATGIRTIFHILQIILTFRYLR